MKSIVAMNMKQLGYPICSTLDVVKKQYRKAFLIKWYSVYFEEVEVVED